MAQGKNKKGQTPSVTAQTSSDQMNPVRQGAATVPAPHAAPLLNQPAPQAPLPPSPSSSPAPPSAATSMVPSAAVPASASPSATLAPGSKTAIPTMTPAVVAQPPPASPIVNPAVQAPVAPAAPIGQASTVAPAAQVAPTVQAKGAHPAAASFFYPAVGAAQAPPPQIQSLNGPAAGPGQGAATSPGGGATRAPRQVNPIQNAEELWGDFKSSMNKRLWASGERPERGLVDVLRNPAQGTRFGRAAAFGAAGAAIGAGIHAASGLLGGMGSITGLTRGEADVGTTTGAAVRAGVAGGALGALAFGADGKMTKPLANLMESFGAMGGDRLLAKLGVTPQAAEGAGNLAQEAYGAVSQGAKKASEGLSRAPTLTERVKAAGQSIFGKQNSWLQKAGAVGIGATLIHAAYTQNALGLAIPSNRGYR